MNMEFNFIGITAALVAFIGIWLGHVSVRIIERNTKSLLPPIIIAVILGLTLEVYALSTANRLLSTATGILGMTILWDALEFVRQERRIKKGHAPANPSNPRHARILVNYPAATTLDLLKRDPIGRQAGPDEAIQHNQRVDHGQ